MKTFIPRHSGKTKSRKSQFIVAALIAAAAALYAHSAQATDGTWTANASTTWSGAGNWSGGIIADGTGAVANFSLTNLTTATRTVTIDAVSRTVGTLLLGDSDITDNRSYTIAGTGSTSLIFDNGGAVNSVDGSVTGALLREVATSKGDTISASVVLRDSLTIQNSSTNTLTISGTVSAGTSGAKTITTSSGNTTFSSAINDGSGTVNVIQNSPGVLTLSASNAFSGGVTIKSGTVNFSNANSLGTGTLVLGGTSGSADAGLTMTSSVSFANAITVQAGSSGNTLSITNNGGTSRMTTTGNIALNNNVMFTIGGQATNSSGGSWLIASGTTAGSGNLTLNVTGGFSTSNNTNSPESSTVSWTGPISTSGTIINAGTGLGISTIAGNISGSSSVTQNSATSLLNLSGSNTYSGSTSVNAGVLRLNSVNALPATGVVTVASGATLQLSGVVLSSSGATVNISGNGSFYTGGALTTSGGSTYAGALILQGNATVAGDNGTLTLTGTVSGSGKTLSVSGASNVVISAPITTGTGGLVKIGTGILTLSGSNTFTGLTSINNGGVLMSSTGALAGGGNITFGGGFLQHSGSNKTDFASRIVNSTGPISIDTNSQVVTYSSGLAASNSGGLTKIGSGTLSLGGTNLYSGITVVNGGVLAVSATTALPSSSSVFIDAAGALNSGGAYTGVQGWLSSTKISTASTGAIVLTASSSENIDFTGYGSLMLGASTNATYTGTMTTAGGFYRLGGGGATLTLSASNTLTGTNGLIVGAANGTGSSTGGVAITGSNNLTGATTINVGTLTLSSTGGIVGSDVTVNAGATFALSGTGILSDSNTNRAKSVTLNGATMTVVGVATANVTEQVSGTLNIGSGASTVKITPNISTEETLTFGGFNRSAGGVVLFSGAGLGVNNIASFTGNSVNVSFGTTPAMSGTGTSGTTIKIIAGAYGDTNSAGTGFGTTGGLVTYDATKGVRLLNTATEYTSAITDGQSQLDNVRYVKTAGSGVTTTTLNSATAINSLSFDLTGTGGSGAGVTIAGSGTLKLNSGVIYVNQAFTGTTVATDSVVISGSSGLNLDLNGGEGIFLVASTGGATSVSRLDVNTAIINGTGLTKGGAGLLVLSGTTPNTYSGTTTINAGSVRLAKTAGVNAIPGDLVINNGATVYMDANEQIANSSNVTINGGILALRTPVSSGGSSSRTETIGSLTITANGGISWSNNGGSLTINNNATVTGNGSSLQSNTQGTLTVGGTLILSDGGTLSVGRSQTAIPNTYDSVTTLTGGLNITNTTTGAYTPVSISFGSTAKNGGELVLNGDVTFTGNSTNTNTTIIDAPLGSGPQGVIALGGTRAFNIGDGAAAVDVAVTAPLIDGTAGASGLTKTGLGTMNLTGASSYTGATSVLNGKLAVNGSLGNTAVTVGNSGTSSLAPTLGGGMGALNGGTLQSLIGSATKQVYASSASIGYIGGAVTISGTGAGGSVGHLAPGNSVGTITMGSLTLSGGSILDYEFNASANDFTVVTGALTLNSGTAGINLYQEGTTTQFTTVGTYDLFQYGSLVGSVSNLSVLNPSGTNSYTFGTTTVSGTNYITLTVAAAAGATATNYTLSVSAGTSKMLTGGSTAITTTITNTGTTGQDGLSYTGLGSTVTGGPGSVTGGTTSGSLAIQTSGSNAGNQKYVSSGSSGVVTVTAGVSSANNSTLGGAATLTGSAGTVSVSVYDPASLSFSGTGNGQTWRVSNAAATAGGLRSDAIITSATLVAAQTQAGWSTALSGTIASSGSAVAASFTPTGKLNGSYQGKLVVSAQNDQTISGASANDVLNSATTSLTATVTGNTSTSRTNVSSADVLSGQSYGTTAASSGTSAHDGTSSGYGLAISGTVAGAHTSTGNAGIPTTATLINGVASARNTVKMSLDTTAANGVTNANRTSDILTLAGLNGTNPSNGQVSLTDIYVLQLTYDTSATGVEYIAWNNGSQFVNAIAGNNTGGVNGNAPSPFGTNALNESYADYLASSPGSLSQQLGAYGYYNGVAWAVLDHTGISDGAGGFQNGTNEFAVIPEPGTWGMILSGFGMLIGIQRLRRRRVGT